MIELHLPWLEFAILLPLIGALLLSTIRNQELARVRCLIVCGATLICALGAWQDFATLHTYEAHDHWDWISAFLGSDALVIDELSAPLLPLAVLLYSLTVLATLRTKVRRFPFSWTLLSLSILLATLSCRNAWGVIGLLAMQAVPTFIELRARGKSTRIFIIHMSLSTILMAAGWAMIQAEGLEATHSILPLSLLMLGVLIRCGTFPFHCWMTDLFENATLGTALLFVTPMTGAYVAVRLLLPVAPDWALRGLAMIALITALYAAGLALVQKEARRFFCYLFMSHSALVLVGLEMVTPIGLTGALCVWLSVSMALAGFGLTIRALEARLGRMSLVEFRGLYQHMPTLAAFFLLTGLASIGFPGTIGFVGAELVVEGAVEIYPFAGMAVVLAAALNSIAVLHAFFRLFTGTNHVASIPLHARWPEKVAVLTLTVLLIGGGLMPQPGVQSRYHAAKEIISRRKVFLAPEEEHLAEHAGTPAVANVPWFWGNAHDSPEN